MTTTKQEHPLAHLKILVTRAEHQAGELSSRLRALGAWIVETPLIEILPPSSYQALDQAIAKLPSYDWLILASTNAAESFSHRVRLIREMEFYNQIDLGETKVAVIGDNTAIHALEKGLNVNFRPPNFVAESFIENFPGYPNLEGVRILWPRTNIGRNLIADELRKAGATVDIVEAYRTGLPADAQALAERLYDLLERREVDAITLTSAQTARNLAEILNLGIKEKLNGGALRFKSSNEIPADDLKSALTRLISEVTLVSIGPETSASMKQCLDRVDLEATPHNAQGIVQTIVAHFGRQ
jgi:uroporphyrinogen III methyltransferase/synthase